MKTWHIIALGVGGFALMRAVNQYRATHRPNDPNQSYLDWSQGLKGVLGLGSFPSIMSASSASLVPSLTTPGATVLALPTPQPAAGMQGLTGFGFMSAEQLPDPATTPLGTRVGNYVLRQSRQVGATPYWSYETGGVGIY